MTVSRVLAELAIDTKSEDITEGADAAGKKLILDTIGTTIAGYDQPGMLPILEQVREWAGKPEASILVHGGKVYLGRRVALFGRLAIPARSLARVG